jgi:hypothetical protein
VIDPPAGKANSKDQRRADVAQRLFKVGAVLFGDLVQTICGQSVQDMGRN